MYNSWSLIGRTLLWVFTFGSNFKVRRTALARVLPKCALNERFQEASMVSAILERP